jgi:hypothetical protein
MRHTYASMRLAEGCNLVQLSRELGHYSPAFTLDVYCHMLEGEEAPPLDLGTALAGAEDRENGQHMGNAPRVVETNEGDAVLVEVV